ncbi:MAG: IS110 family transposase [Phycisphaerae bacterium]
MKFVGVDLHKHSIKLCVLVVLGGKRKVVSRRSFACSQPQAIRAFFQELGDFRVVVEATASYEWFFLLIEDLADRLVLAHPKKLRVIAESTCKTDKIDAEVLATFLALDMIPEAYRPSPRVQQHRVLVRHRHWLQGRITAVKCKIRNKAAHYNADIAELFRRSGERHLAEVAMSVADRYAVDALWNQWTFLGTQLQQADRQLQEFAKSAPAAEREARAVLSSIPQIGPVTVDVVLSELGDWRRFRSAKAAVAYAGLDPGVRQSAGKRLDLHIRKEGSRILRWVLIEAAWRLVARLQRWRRLFNRLCDNTGSKKKAIVAVARHLLCMMFSMLQAGKAYRYAA